jgi:hypothetical protein
MLEQEPAVIAQIREQVPAFETVGNPSLISGIQDIGHLLPLCIVVPGEAGLALPKEPDWRGTAPIIEVQRWDVLIFLAHQNIDQTDGLTEIEASKLMRQVFKALHGFQTKRVAQDAGFIYSGREAPAYMLGWARFAMTFHARLALSDYEYQCPAFFQSYKEAAKTLGDIERAV